VWCLGLLLPHPVRIRLAVRRFFCGSPDCAAVTVAEQVEGLTARHARRAKPLARTLTAIEAGLHQRPPAPRRAHDRHSFARGLKHDHDAVLNGPHRPWSSGGVEGNVNRLEMLK
jgi:hypothetical protein